MLGKVSGRGMSGKKEQIYQNIYNFVWFTLNPGTRHRGLSLITIQTCRKRKPRKLKGEWFLAWPLRHTADCNDSVRHTIRKLKKNLTHDR